MRHDPALSLDAAHAMSLPPAEAMAVLPKATFMAEDRLEIASGPNLDIAPAAADAGRGRPQAPVRRGRVTLFLSLLLHVAAAAAFVAAGDRAVRLEGAEQAGIVQPGNAPSDQLQAGSLADATNVTLVTMLSPRKVAVTEATAVVPETVQAVSEPAGVPDAVQAEAESVQRAESEVATQVGVDAAGRPHGQTPAVTVPAERTAEPVPAAPAPAQIVTSHAPPVLRAETLSAADAVAVRAVRTPSAENAAATPAEPIVARAVAAQEMPAKKKSGKVVLRPENHVAKAGRKLPAKASGKANPTKVTPNKQQARPLKKPAGNAGSSTANARRGGPDGQASGKAAQGGTSGKSKEAGNAAASNYPGQIAARLRRAARMLPGSMSRRSGRNATVAFVVRADGSLGNLRISGSSGSPELDRAALAIVRRAAPFPPIPAGTGRSSWPFALPIGVLR